MESIKQEIGEELEKNELKPIEYDKDNLIEEVDDSWIRLDDKLLLLKYYKDLTAIEFPWADKALEQCIVLKKYYSTIKVMDKEQYLNDIENPVKSVLSLID
tara:strand:+ start:62 stop:364 length:303 start_codon:yes stop_codon:yes gene_type:complete